MRLLDRNPRLSGLLVGLAVLALAGARAQAQPEISSTEPGSIVVYPKVIADGTRDTIISLTNTTNMMAYVHCEATNGLGTCSNSPDPANQIYYCNSDEECLDVVDPEGATLENVGPCEIPCPSTDFDVVLTAHQPTFWRVTTGRVQDPALASGNMCTSIGNQQFCPGFFLAPVDNQGAGGNVPGMSGFRGELRCFQVDQTGALIAGNALKGEAFIEALGVDGTGVGLLSGYNSVNIQGGEAPSGNVANLDGVEYARCPAALTFNHLAPGSADPISDADVEVEFSFAPCTFSPTFATVVRVSFNTWDEMEIAQSGGDQRACWANYRGSLTGGMIARTTDFLRSSAAPGQTGNCTAGSAVGFGCTSDSNCGKGGICFDNECVAGDSTGMVCSSAANCGVGGVCGPPSGILGVAEHFYTDELSIPGTSADLAHQLGIRTINDVMSFTGGF